jgi:hypothetical protein
MYMSAGDCWATASPFPKPVSSLSKVRNARFASPRAADAFVSGPAMHRLRIRSICSWCSCEKDLRLSPWESVWVGGGKLEGSSDHLGYPVVNSLDVGQ